MISLGVLMPGTHRHAGLLAAAYDGRAEAGRDDEPGTRLERLVDLAGGEDGAGADDQVVVLGEAAQDGRGLGRAEGRLGDGRPPSTRAAPSASALAGSSRTTTGTIRWPPRTSVGFTVWTALHRSSAMTVLSSV